MTLPFILIIAIFTAAPTGHAFQRVDLNCASFQQIALLPGIGKKLAQEITSFREKHGAFSNLAALKKIPGYSEKKFSKIRNHINFGPAPKDSLASKAPKKSSKIKVKPMIAFAHLERALVKANRLSFAETDQLIKSARRSAWLPRLTTAIDFDADLSQSERKVIDSSDTYYQRGGRGFSVGLRLSFDLPSLLYHRDELDVQKFAFKKRERREALVAKLHRNYFDYKNLNVDLTIAASDEEVRSIESRLEKIAATIDAMTDHAFSDFQTSSSTLGVVP